MWRQVTVNLTSLPAQLLGGDVIPHDLLDLGNASGPPLAAAWTVPMAQGEVKVRAPYLSAPFLCNGGKSRLCVLDRHYAGDMHRR